MSKYGVISGPYFPVLSPNTGKCVPEITPYLDTFHAVYLKDICNATSAEQITDEQPCWEYIKYEIRKFSICFSKEKAKRTRAKTFTLENKLKELEQNPDCIFDRNYLSYKNRREEIYEEKANGVKIRSKCEWYERGEKSSNFFLSPEKQHALLNQVRILLCGEKEVTDKHKINQELECFYKNLFTKISELQKKDINAYLSQINIPILTEEQSQTCEGPIIESELLNALKSMPNNKPPGNDDLTKEFYETFWEEIKNTFV